MKPDVTLPEAQVEMKAIAVSLLLPIPSPMRTLVSRVGLYPDDRAEVGHLLECSR
jgi:hypothetical protein